MFCVRSLLHRVRRALQLLATFRLHLFIYLFIATLGDIALRSDVIRAIEII